MADCSVKHLDTASMKKSIETALFADKLAGYVRYDPKHFEQKGSCISVGMKIEPGNISAAALEESIVRRFVTEWKNQRRGALGNELVGIKELEINVQHVSAGVLNIHCSMYLHQPLAQDVK